MNTPHYSFRSYTLEQIDNMKVQIPEIRKWKFYLPSIKEKITHRMKNPNPFWDSSYFSNSTLPPVVDPKEEMVRTAMVGNVDPEEIQKEYDSLKLEYQEALDDWYVRYDKFCEENPYSDEELLEYRKPEEYHWKVKVNLYLTSKERERASNLYEAWIKNKSFSKPRIEVLPLKKIPEEAEETPLRDSYQTTYQKLKRLFNDK